MYLVSGYSIYVGPFNSLVTCNVHRIMPKI